MSDDKLEVGDRLLCPNKVEAMKVIEHLSGIFIFDWNFLANDEIEIVMEGLIQ